MPGSPSPARQAFPQTLNDHDRRLSAMEVWAQTVLLWDLTSSQQPGDWVFQREDFGTCVEGTSEKAQKFTIPSSQEADIPVGALIAVCQMGQGTVTVAPGNGVILDAPRGVLSTASQYQTIMLRQRVLDQWVVLFASTDLPIPINQQPASYIFQASDIGARVESTGASAQTFTVPAGLGSAGDVIEISQMGTGTLTVAGASGVTVNSPAGLAAAARYATMGIIKEPDGSWTLSGYST